MILCFSFKKKGVRDDNDSDPLDPYVCQDLDNDQCDDCVYGVDQFGPEPDFKPLDDGLDTDSDGLCNVGDPDDDNDGTTILFWRSRSATVSYHTIQF